MKKVVLVIALFFGAIFAVAGSIIPKANNETEHSISWYLNELATIDKKLKNHDKVAENIDSIISTKRFYQELDKESNLKIFNRWLIASRTDDKNTLYHLVEYFNDRNLGYALLKASIHGRYTNTQIEGLKELITHKKALILKHLNGYTPKILNREAIVYTGKLNIRETNIDISDSSTIIGTVEKRSFITIKYYIKNKWAFIESDGQLGYVNTKYIKIIS